MNKGGCNLTNVGFGLPMPVKQRLSLGWRLALLSEGVGNCTLASSFPLQPVASGRFDVVSHEGLQQEDVAERICDNAPCIPGSGHWVAQRKQ